MLLQKFFKVKLEEYNKVFKKRSMLRSISIFYTLYNVALSVLEIKDENYKKKCKFWKLYLRGDKERREKYFKKLSRFMEEDLLIILEAQQKLAELKKKEEFADESIENSGAIGIVNYAHPTLLKDDTI